jgi:hypothetical protein
MRIEDERKPKKEAMEKSVKTKAMYMQTHSPIRQLCLVHDIPVHDDDVLFLLIVYITHGLDVPIKISSDWQPIIVSPECEHLHISDLGGHFLRRIIITAIGRVQDIADRVDRIPKSTTICLLLGIDRVGIDFCRCGIGEFPFTEFE